jgi:hypothetical protein
MKRSIGPDFGCPAWIILTAILVSSVVYDTSAAAQAITSPLIYVGPVHVTRMVGEIWLPDGIDDEMNLSVQVYLENTSQESQSIDLSFQDRIGSTHLTFDRLGSHSTYLAPRMHLVSYESGGKKYLRCEIPLMLYVNNCALGRPVTEVEITVHPSSVGWICSAFPQMIMQQPHVLRVDRFFPTRIIVHYPSVEELSSAVGCLMAMTAIPTIINNHTIVTVSLNIRRAPTRGSLPPGSRMLLTNRFPVTDFEPLPADYDLTGIPKSPEPGFLESIWNWIRGKSGRSRGSALDPEFTREVTSDGKEYWIWRRTIDPPELRILDVGQPEPSVEVSYRIRATHALPKTMLEGTRAFINGAFAGISNDVWLRSTPPP